MERDGERLRNVDVGLGQHSGDPVLRFECVSPFPLEFMHSKLVFVLRPRARICYRLTSPNLLFVIIASLGVPLRDMKVVTTLNKLLLAQYFADFTCTPITFWQVRAFHKIASH